MTVLVGRAKKPRWAKVAKGSETARRLVPEQRGFYSPRGFAARPRTLRALLRLAARQRTRQNRHASQAINFDPKIFAPCQR